MSAESSSAVVGAGSAWQSMIPMVLIFVIFYFFLIRPQLKRQRELDKTINNLKKGDKVVAAGGLYGVISKIDGNILFLEIADNVKIKALKSSVTQVLNAENTAPAEIAQAKEEAPQAEKPEKKKAASPITKSKKK